jgi:hypothetical protein
MSRTTVPAPVRPAGEGRDRFRTAVLALEPGPLRDVLVAVAYARDAAARTGAPAPPDDRWWAVVAAADRAVREVAAERPRLHAA